MKIFFTAILLLCLPGLALLAQDRTICGVIVDSLSHSPLNGATVVLNPGNRTTISDENGQFRFSKVINAETAIIISAVGYERRKFYCTIPIRHRSLSLLFMRPGFPM